MLERKRRADPTKGWWKMRDLGRKAGRDEHDRLSLRGTL